MRRLAVTVAAVVAVTETYRRGYLAPLLLGGRLWLSAAGFGEAYEPEVIA